jgi:hypothetical protein
MRAITGQSVSAALSAMAARQHSALLKAALTAEELRPFGED